MVVYHHSVVTSQRTLSYKEYSVWGNRELSQKLCEMHEITDNVTQRLDVMGFSKYIYQTKTCISKGDVMSRGLKC
jgi:hypothetical protein